MVAKIRDDSAPMRLLPGEIADTDDLEDARVWAAVYDELWAFLGRKAGDRDGEFERFRQRLEHWQRRCGELSRTNR